MNHALKDDEHLIIKSYQSGLVEPVIIREYNTLTLAEARKHSDECKAAMLLELSRWNDMGAWRRFSRKQAGNILDSRWVLKWKLNEGRKIIQARLTARGYKDRQGDTIATFSGVTT